MLNGDRKPKKPIAKLTEEEFQRIRDYIQGSVYCYCKNNPDQWFAARDLFGGENDDWSGTPLHKLYEWHRDNNSNNPIKKAGIDVGCILRDVIWKDRRLFEIKKQYTNQYKLIKEIDINDGQDEKIED